MRRLLVTVCAVVLVDMMLYSVLTPLLPEIVDDLDLDKGSAGLLVAAYMYIWREGLGAKLAANNGLLYTFFYNKWFFDELYDAIFVKPSLAIGRLFWKKGDGATIDGLGPDGIAARARDVAAALVRFQSGYLYHYAFVMLIGVAGLVSYFMLSR